MPDDDAFLRAITDDPNQDSLRLVYADWLEERGDARGSFLRVTIELEALERTEPPPDMRSRLARVRRIGQLRHRWRELLPLVDRNWFALLHRGELRCGGVPDGACPRRWDRLPRESRKPCTRYCGVCGRWVRLCWSTKDVERAIRSRGVVAPVAPVPSGWVEGPAFQAHQAQRKLKNLL
jgi:uncharacterized protein (TIGR02996 family)